MNRVSLSIKMNYKNLVIAVLIVFLVVLNCRPNKENNNLKKQEDVVKQMEIERLREKDSLLILLAQSEKHADILKGKNDSLISVIKTVRNRPKKQPKNLDELESYFKERYKTEEVRTVESKELAVSENIAKDVVFELESFDIEKEVSLFKEMIIENQKSIITNLETDKNHLSLLNISAEKEIDERKKLQEIANQTIKDLKRSNKLGKVGALGVGVGVGVLLGILITN